MKCSLLTLSTFIDGELAPQRRAEVDAHLVGCTRCSGGAATLREEKSRVGQLARVTVDPGSAQLMLEQVGIAVDPRTDLGQAPPAPSPPPDDDRRPWQRATSSAALPWTPRRPDPLPPLAGDETPVSSAVHDEQPELPLDGVRSVPPSWNRPAAADPPRAAGLEEAVDPSEPSVRDATRHADPDEDLATGSIAPDSWEADLPPPADPTPHHVASWTAPAPPPPLEAAAPPLPPDAPAAQPASAPPTRVATASGPAALWTRIHDAVSVRLALARGGDALEDSVQIVSGAPVRRGEQLPPPELAAPGIVAASPSRQMPAVMVPPDLELTDAGEIQMPVVHGTDAQSRPPVAEHPADRFHAASPEVGDPRSHEQDLATAPWNAFAASSYPEVDVPPQPAAEQSRQRPRPLGRHSRAVAREQVPMSTRIGRVSAASVAALRAGAITATARLRQGVGRVGKSGTDKRLLAGIAAVGVIFVVALVVGRSSSRPAAPGATRPASAASSPQAHTSAPAKSSAAAVTSGAAVPVAVQTYGAGDTGFQVIRLRYGAQAHYMRVVFDMGAASGAAAGTPKVTVAFTNPTTILVTFNGTAAAGSTGTPTPGNVISSVSLVSSGGNKAVYRFGLTRAATATAFYLASPTRFVLDIH